MGVKISIDKHVSELDDILEMSPQYLSKVQFESKISPDITQHLKVSLFFITEFRSGDSMSQRKLMILSNRRLYLCMEWQHR